MMRCSWMISGTVTSAWTSGVDGLINGGFDMARVHVVMKQGYNDIEMSFPNAMMAGLFMDDAIIATNGDVTFRVTVEPEEEKEADANA